MTACRRGPMLDRSRAVINGEAIAVFCAVVGR